MIKTFYVLYVLDAMAYFTSLKNKSIFFDSFLYLAETVGLEAETESEAVIESTASSSLI